MIAEKRALVTGGAKRIGAQIVRTLAGAGYAVCIHANTSMAEAEALAGSLRSAGHHACTARADLADRAAVGTLIGAAQSALGGPPTLLVNNASSFRYDTAQSFDVDDIDFHWGPNLEAPLILSRDFAGALGDGPGAIVNILDYKIEALNPDFFTYTVAKLGLAGATRLLAMSFGGRIRTNGVAPGITLVSGMQTEAGFQRAWAAPPLGRSSSPEEVADAVLFAAEAASLNGEILVLDGGDRLLQRKRDIAFDS